MPQNMNQMILQDKDGKTLGSFEVVDSVAREAIENFPIEHIVSDSADTGPFLRSLESGSYVLRGKFRAHEGATGVLSFSSALMVNVIKSTSKSSVQIFYPVSNCVQFLEITDTTMTRTNVYLNTVLENIGTLTELATNEKTSLVAAINELAAQLSSKGKIAEVSLLASGWVGEASPYSQVVNVEGATANSQIDLTPSVEQLAIFHEKDLAFVAENEDGVVTVYAIGDKPTNDYTMQVTITEVSA